MITTIAMPAPDELTGFSNSTPQPGKIPPVLALEPALQHYEWGDPDYIPTLLGRGNPRRKPHAELWLGAHVQAPSQASLNSAATPLDELVTRAGVEILGHRVASDFAGRLPFLLKVLSAAAPLSIQVHPTPGQAETGYDRENRGGIPINASHRNYKDTSHKPELIVALTEFFGVSGFRPPRDIWAELEAVPELQGLTTGLPPEPGSLKELYTRLMTMNQDRVDRVLGALIQRLKRWSSERPFTRREREYWILRSDEIYSKNGHHDRGLFSLYLLNLIHLRPGQGLYLPAGVLHAYLEGSGVELMACSNNVIRGGLTSKHVDVPELLNNVSFEELQPAIISARAVSGSPEFLYPTPAREFELSRLELETGRRHEAGTDHAVEIFLVLSAENRKEVSITSAGQIWRFGKGEAFLVCSGAAYTIESEGRATLYKATVPATAILTSDPAAGVQVPGFRGRQPARLSFGTSGLRGLVTDITDLEAYLNTRGFLDYLAQTADSSPGQPVCLGCDLRPSSDSPDRSILRAVAKAIEDAGFVVEHLGALPTPALTFHAIRHRRASVMVTGSHIPFDRNGIKFNKSTGEVLKEDEPGILEAVARFRAIEYARAQAESLFLDDGMFKASVCPRPPRPDTSAANGYLERYENFLPASALKGLRIVFYQHSAVGRDLLVELLKRLGAEVIPMGRSDQFVPVDTEAITDDKLAILQDFLNEARRKQGSIDAVVSTDGDSDRPLLAGVDENGCVRFFGGDLLGIVAAEFLGADTAVVPISANDAVDRWAVARGVAVIKTKIGSPYVIDGMRRAVAKGARRVVGWEANGGFLTATPLERNGRTLEALPTRDAVLPLLAALCAANERGLSLVKLFARLPRRFSKAGLIDNFPPGTSRRLVRRFSSGLAGAEQVQFSEDSIQLRNEQGAIRQATEHEAAELNSLRRELEHHFSAGFGRVVRINILDGVRIEFSNGDIAHVRPSGNAPQLRLYAVADNQERADTIVAEGIREPDGLLRRIESALDRPPLETDLVRRVRQNIELTRALFARKETPEVIGTVSGSKSAQQFWQGTLDASRKHFGCREALSFQEDLPTNQAFGLLLLWQRLKPHLGGDRGSLVAFVFGDGTRSTPFTETDNGQKPAIATFVPAGPDRDARFISMVELALQYFVPVQQYLRRSGFEGLVVKWGDEIQIPALDLAGSNSLFRDADVVRFVSMREITADDALNKDWVGVDANGHVTAFIPRRPLEKMTELADRGLVQRREGRLHGGINLGSIAVSYAFLDSLLEEFRAEVNDATADRKDRPALDPEFFTALTVAVLPDPVTRAEAWERAAAESPDVAALGRRIPDILYRLQRAIRSLEERQKRKLKMVAMDFEDQYWGDIGQHSRICEFYMALNQSGPAGDIARAIAGIPITRDAGGNILVNSEVSSEIKAQNSVLINCRLTGRGSVEGCVLIGTRARNIEAADGFDVLSTVSDLCLKPRGGTYKVVSAQPVMALSGERLTTLFLPGLGARLFRVMENTDLKDKKATYAVPIAGNPLSFQQAHAEMGALSMETLRELRTTAEAGVLRGDTGV